MRFLLLLSLVLVAWSAHAQSGFDTGFPDSTAVLIVGGHWFDGEGFEPNRGILARNGRFLRVDAVLDVPDDALLLTLDDDQFILPGLVDLHAHYNMDLLGEGRVEELVYNPMLYLANGVTTTFPAGEYDPEDVLAARGRIDRGEQVGPRILPSGPYIGRSNPEWGAEATREAVYALVDEWAARGVVGFKAKGASPSEVEALIRRAHQHGLTVTGHLDSGFRGTTNARDAIRMGIDRVEHILGGHALDPERPAYPVWNEVDTTDVAFRAIVQDFLDHHVYFSATVTAPVYFASPDETEGFDDWADERAFFTPYVRQIWAERDAQRTRVPLFDALYHTMLRTTKAFYDAGGGHLITLGTDKPSWGDFLPGFSAHREMHALVLAGLPEAAVLRIATQNGAAAINRGSLLGRLAPGALADLFIVRGNPLDDIRHTRNVEAVMKSGRLYDPARLQEAARGRIGPMGPEERANWTR